MQPLPAHAEVSIDRLPLVPAQSCAFLGRIAFALSSPAYLQTSSERSWLELRRRTAITSAAPSCAAYSTEEKAADASAHQCTPLLEAVAQTASRTGDVPLHIPGHKARLQSLRRKTSIMEADRNASTGTVCQDGAHCSVRIACLQRGAGLHPKMMAALGSTAPHHDLTELPGTSLLPAGFQSRPPGVCKCDVPQTTSGMYMSRMSLRLRKMTSVSKRSGD